MATRHGTGHIFPTSLYLGGRYGIKVLAASQEQHSRHFARVVDIHPADDHTLYIGHVEYLRHWERRPLLLSGKYKQVEALEPMNAWSISSEGW